jgi:hypothetical protein
MTGRKWKARNHLFIRVLSGVVVGGTRGAYTDAKWRWISDKLTPLNSQKQKDYENELCTGNGGRNGQLGRGGSDGG